MWSWVMRMLGWKRVVTWLPVDDSFGNDKYIGISRWERS